MAVAIRGIRMLHRFGCAAFLAAGTAAGLAPAAAVAGLGRGAPAGAVIGLALGAAAVAAAGWAAAAFPEGGAFFKSKGGGSSTVLRPLR